MTKISYRLFCSSVFLKLLTIFSQSFDKTESTLLMAKLFSFDYSVSVTLMFCVSSSAEQSRQLHNQRPASPYSRRLQSISVASGTLNRRDPPAPGSLPPTLSNSLAPKPSTLTTSRTVKLFLP